MSAPFQDWSRNCATSIERVLGDHLPSREVIPNRLHDAMRYSTLGGGKRVRAMLVQAAGTLTHAPQTRLNVVAAAVEMIHAYSLIHDDLPCMDDDVLRRGRPTCHIEFDEATALLAGDALQALAFEIVSANTLSENPADQLALISLFARACGSRGMAGGQAIDLDSVGKTLTLAELEFMHIQKTGALIHASVMMGALCGTADTATRAHLDRYGKCIGLAFQVVDDILDCESNTEQLGKTAGKDKDANKPTYVSLMGLAPAKQFADELLRDALDAVSTIGDDAQRLRELAHFIVDRTH